MPCVDTVGTLMSGRCSVLLCPDRNAVLFSDPQAGVMEAFVFGNRVRDPDYGGHLPGSPPAALAQLRVPNSLLPRIVARLLSRWRLGRCRVRVDRDGAPLSLYVVSATDNQGVLVPLRDTSLRAWAVDPCRPFHREVHTSECCIRQGRSWRLTRPLTNQEEEGRDPGSGGTASTVARFRLRALPGRTHPPAHPDPRTGRRPPRTSAATQADSHNRKSPTPRRRGSGRQSGPGSCISVRQGLANDHLTVVLPGAVPPLSRVGVGVRAQAQLGRGSLRVGSGTRCGLRVEGTGPWPAGRDTCLPRGVPPPVASRPARRASGRCQSGG